MQRFTGREYLLIDIANAFGLDKCTWIVRLAWAYLQVQHFEDLVEEADDKYLYAKAVNAWRQVEAGNPTGHIMFLDSTASGLQLMAVLSGCLATAKATNLINTGMREDVYMAIAEGMEMTRNEIKKPLMTTFYNKQSVDGFNESQQEHFDILCSEAFPGPVSVLGLVNDAWDNTALYHQWTLPDGHIAHKKVVETVMTSVEVDELEHTSVTVAWAANQAKDWYGSLAPDVVHSVDAYVAREMVRRATAQEFQLVTIHDAFGACPNHMNKVRQNYIDILVEIAESNLLQDILSEITGESVQLTKDSYDLPKYIKESEYALS